MASSILESGMTEPVPIGLGQRISGHRGLRRLTRSRAAMAGLGIVLALTLISIAAPLISPHDPLATASGPIRATSLKYRCSADTSS